MILYCYFYLKKTKIWKQLKCLLTLTLHLVSRRPRHARTSPGNLHKCQISTKCDLLWTCQEQSCSHIDRVDANSCGISPFVLEWSEYHVNFIYLEMKIQSISGYETHEHLWVEKERMYLPYIPIIRLYICTHRLSYFNFSKRYCDLDDWAIAA